MERYYKNIRFILTANVLGKMSQMMVSRCSLFHLRALHPSQIEKLLGKICLKERKVVPMDVRKAIISVSNGDARLAINVLEAMMNLENPTPSDVFNVVGRTDPTNVYQLLHRAVQGRVEDTFDTFHLLIERDGTNPSAVLQQIFYSVLKNKVRGLTEKQRLRILIHLGDLPYTTDDLKLGGFLSKLLDDEQLRISRWK